MKLGFMTGMPKNGICSIDDYIADIKAAEKLGFDQAWMAQVFSTDAITMMSIAGRETSTIRLGTAVVPSYPRHPTTMALQILTASAASQGRFDLGLGLSHQLVIEDMYGLDYSKPASHMREYLEVLMPLVRGERCDFDGEEFKVHAQMMVPDAVTPVPVIIAALGPKMLDIAGTLADGTTTWMTGPKTLATHTIPLIQQAAAKANRKKPRIVASFPIVLTNDKSKAREVIAKKIEIYGHIPSYKNMLKLEGTDAPADLALLGNAVELTDKILHLKEIGVTDFNAFCFELEAGASQQTMEFLASIKTLINE